VTFIDKFLNTAGDSDPEDVQKKLHAFRSLLLLHVSVQSWNWLYLHVGVAGGQLSLMLLVAALVLTGCFALSFYQRMAHWAPLVAIPVLFVELQFFFPGASNSLYLALWAMLFLALLDDRAESDRALALQGLQWSTAIVFFAAGLQKVLYGAYFSGDFLSFAVGIDPVFANLYGFLIPVDELLRLQAIDPTLDGAGPYRASAPLLVAVSNAVWIAELLIPIGLLARRTRPWAALVGMVFVVLFLLCIRDVAHGLLMITLLSLFLPRGWMLKAFWPLVFIYLCVLGMSVGYLPGVELFHSSPVTGRAQL
jgi:hypothetical protein